ncbi:MAG: ribosome biogenesis GTP-binding protein YihA/YsxC [Oscillospiraceae bacterium]|nr:ribosome biogenesis GTP-binding protein YihA/YsxC [Oscillospiraceae bacterium]MDD3833244.1 ribosome biogenesis GTP-binding protein YihA/YsxC [Oscillospiraceae bacterium]MDD4545849.1 ribosome biogenesis GTP-binding protein YihA/YsxC [Oscillospiraceae bacterium]
MEIQTAVFEMSFGISSQIPPSVLPEIVFSGRSNVGKSSLINKILNRKSLARISATPGKTATINFYRLDSMRLVDLPGYGYAKVSQSERQRWSELIEGYFNDDRDLRLVVQLIDMRHPPTVDDYSMLEYLTQREIPFIIALTKSDKLNKTERNKRLDDINTEFADFIGVKLIPFSSKNGEGVVEIRDILDLVTQD